MIDFTLMIIYAYMLLTVVELIGETISHYISRKRKKDREQKETIKKLNEMDRKLNEIEKRLKRE